MRSENIANKTKKIEKNAPEIRSYVENTKQNRALITPVFSACFWKNMVPLSAKAG